MDQHSDKKVLSDTENGYLTLLSKNMDALAEQQGMQQPDPENSDDENYDTLYEENINNEQSATSDRDTLNTWNRGYLKPIAVQSPLKGGFTNDEQNIFDAKNSDNKDKLDGGYIHPGALDGKYGDYGYVNDSEFFEGQENDEGYDYIPDSVGGLGTNKDPINDIHGNPTQQFPPSVTKPYEENTYESLQRKGKTTSGWFCQKKIHCPAIFITLLACVIAITVTLVLVNKKDDPGSESAALPILPTPSTRAPMHSASMQTGNIYTSPVSVTVKETETTTTTESSHTISTEYTPPKLEGTLPFLSINL